MTSLTSVLRLLAFVLCVMPLRSEAQWITRDGMQNAFVWAALDGDAAVPRRLFASRRENDQLLVYSTDDEGLTWQIRDIGGNLHPSWLGAVPAANGLSSSGTTLYASVLVSSDIFNGYRCALLRSDDRGVNWKTLVPSVRACYFTIDPSDPHVMYGINNDTFFWPIFSSVT